MTNDQLRDALITEMHFAPSLAESLTQCSEPIRRKLVEALHNLQGKPRVTTTETTTGAMVLTENATIPKDITESLKASFKRLGYDEQSAERMAKGRC